MTILDGKSPRTIQRFISTINSFLKESNLAQQVRYDTASNQFYLEFQRNQYFNAKQILLISKVLLSTRSLNNKEISTILNSQISKLTPDEQKVIKQSVESETFHYESGLEEQGLLDIIWELNALILRKKVIEIEYSNALNTVNAYGAAKLP